MRDIAQSPEVIPDEYDLKSADDETKGCGRRGRYSRCL